MMTSSKCFQRISKTHSVRDRNFQELTILAARLLSPASLLKLPFPSKKKPKPKNKHKTNKNQQQQQKNNQPKNLKLQLCP